MRLEVYVLERCGSGDAGGEGIQFEGLVGEGSVLIYHGRLFSPHPYVVAEYPLSNIQCLIACESVTTLMKHTNTNIHCTMAQLVHACYTVDTLKSNADGMTPLITYQYQLPINNYSLTVNH